MQESDFEKIRNRLAPIYFLLETMKYGTSYIEKESLLDTAFESMQDIKELLDKIERTHEKR